MLSPGSSCLRTPSLRAALNPRVLSRLAEIAVQWRGERRRKRGPGRQAAQRSALLSQPCLARRCQKGFARCGAAPGSARAGREESCPRQPPAMLPAHPTPAGACSRRMSIQKGAPLCVNSTVSLQMGGLRHGDGYHDSVLEPGMRSQLGGGGGRMQWWGQDAVLDHLSMSPVEGLR